MPYKDPEVGKAKAKERAAKNKERIKAYQKKYRQENATKIKQQKATHYKTVCEATKEHVKKYRQENAKEIRERSRARYEANKDVFKKRKQEYYKRTKEETNRRRREYRATHKKEIAEKDRLYRLAHPETNLKKHFNRRELGYQPMNSPFPGCAFHHMHLKSPDGTSNKSIGIHVPEKLHKSVYHNHRTGEGMAKINARCLKWLAVMRGRLK